MSWEVTPLNDLIDGLNAGVSVRSKEGDASKPAVLKTSAIWEGRVRIGEVKSIVAEDEARAKTSLEANAVLISRMNTPNLVGAVGFSETADAKIFLPDRLWLARSSRQTETDMRWLAYALGFGQVSRAVRGLATGTSDSMKNIPKSRLLALGIPTPPLPEQRRIANALHDVDRLIESLRKLLDKEANLAEGLRQALLTGSTRLAGFTQPWTTKSIGEVLEPRTEKNVNRHPLEVLSCTKHSGFVRSLDYFKNQVFSRNLSGYRVIYRGDIGYPANHIEEGSIGVQELFDRALVSPIYVVMKPIAGSDSFFLQRQLKLDQYRQRFAQATNSSVNRRGSLRWPEFSQIEVDMPEPDEQRAISQVIRDAEAVVGSMQRRLVSLHAMKQGVAQELLTGAIRLTEEVVA